MNETGIETTVTKLYNYAIERVRHNSVSMLKETYGGNRIGPRIDP